MSLNNHFKLESTPSSICPTTGLSLIRRSEWTNVSFGKDYRGNVSVLGGCILISQPSGYATAHDVIEVFRLAKKVISETMGDHPYIHLEDYTNLTGASLEARRCYMEIQKKQKQLLGIVYYGLSPLLKMNIKLANTFRVFKFDVGIVSDYAEAVNHALLVLSAHNIRPEDLFIGSGPHPSFFSQRKDNICPITGLKITTKPEWTDIDLGDGYSVSFKFIGKRILHSFSRGKAGKQNIKNLFMERAKVLNEMLDPQDSIIELRDYFGVHRTITRAARVQMAKELNANKERMIGFIGYNAPLSVKLAMNVGKSLYKSPFPVSVVRDYKTAIKNAVEILKKHGYSKEVHAPKKVTSEDWSILLDDLSVQFEIINGNIIHSVAKGILKEAHIASLFQMKDKVLEDTGLSTKPFFVLTNLRGLKKADRKAKWCFVKAIRESYEKYLFKLYVFYGVGPILRSVIFLLRPFVPFKVRVGRDFGSALKIIANEKNKNLHLSTQRKPKYEKTGLTYTSKQVGRYVDELLFFLSNLNWESDKIDETSIEIDSSHPFRPVFDALSLIKMDLNDLLKERRVAEKALGKEKAYLEHLIESAPEAIAMSDISHKILRINKEFTRLFGYSNKEVRGRSIDDLIVPDELKDEAVNASHQVGQAGQVIYFDSIRQHKDGSLVDVSILASPIKMDGEQLGYYGIYRDITERKLAEKKLQNAKKEWERTFDAISDVVTIQDAERRIIQMNKATVKLLNKKPEDIINKYCYQLFMNKSEPCPGCPGLDTVRRNIPGTAEIKQTHTNKVFQVSTAPILDDNKEFAGIIHAARDITQHKQLESHFRQAQKMEAIGTLAGGIAHDFNNVLYPIFGYAEMTMDDVPEKSLAYRNLKEILKAASRATDLVQQFLTFSRQSEQEPKLIKVQPIVKEALKLLRFSFPSTVNIQYSIDEDCGPIKADPSQIHQIIMNLCTNAYQSMGERGGKLDVNLVSVNISTENLKEYPNLEPGPYLQLSVSDTGHGIDQTILDRIFDPYFTTRGPGEGTGVGLSVVHGIVKSFKGDIKVSSRKDEGTTFDVFFPVAEVSKEDAPAVSPGQILTGTEHIFLVDDEDDIVEMGQQMLGRLGYRVTGFTDSLEALAAFRKNPKEIDLVITDQTMPNLTGIELAKKLVKIRPDIPIILCSGFSEVISKEEVKAIGIREYIDKPIVRNTIAGVIRQIFDSERTPK
jgi:PAS domain S-box-containing protein